MVLQWVRHPRALWRASLGRVVVLAPDSDEPQVLEGSGALLWDLLAVAATTATLAEELAIAYGAEPATVGADIGPMLAHLTAIGAVREASA